MLVRTNRERRVCRQGRDDRYAWPNHSPVIEVATTLKTGSCLRTTGSCLLGIGRSANPGALSQSPNIQACAAWTQDDYHWLSRLLGPRFRNATYRAVRAGFCLRAERSSGRRSGR